MYEVGKIYRLGAPSNGVIGGRIVRFPMGLPVKLVRQHEDYFEVVEPYGETVLFPLTFVRSLGRKMTPEELFEEGAKNVGKVPLLLEEFPSKEEAEKAWNEYAEGQNRWYIDSLRERLGKSVYSDWEVGFSENDVKYILKAARLFLTRADGEPIYDEDIINAICDIALNIYSGDSPGWTEDVEPKVAENVAAAVVMAVEQMLTHSYFVRSGGTWDLRKKQFRVGDTVVE